MIRKLFGIFRVKREERWPALLMLVYIIALNALTVIRYGNEYLQLSDNYNKLFVRTFHVSGYDPLTYSVVSSWGTLYNVYRHPLLAFFMYIPNQINQALMILTGHNLVQYVVGAILVFCSFYSFIFLYRILREVRELSRRDSMLLSCMYFSFGYVMVASMVPDHFILSMMMLLLTLYISGIRQKRGLDFNIWQTWLLFIFTAGISLNNGLKTFLAAWFTNGKRFFRPRYLLLAIVVPSLLIWLCARLEYKHFVYPDWEAKQEKKEARAAKEREAIYADYVSHAHGESQAAIRAAVDSIVRERAATRAAIKESRLRRKHGEPMGKGEFSSWTDVSSSRMDAAVENLFGESIQLHQQHLLGDVLKKRPMIVTYDWLLNYLVEGFIVVLFVIGIWCGRKDRFLWTVMSFFLLDMMIHMVLGFGINEVYIMAPHWLYVIPVAISYILTSRKHAVYVALLCCLSLVSIYLFAYNGGLLCRYMLG